MEGMGRIATESRSWVGTATIGILGVGIGILLSGPIYFIIWGWRAKGGVKAFGISATMVLNAALLTENPRQFRWYEFEVVRL